MEKLIEEDDLYIDFIDHGDKKLLHLSIKNLHKLDFFDIGGDNNLFLKLRSISNKKESEGLKLTHMEGKNVNLEHHAGAIAFKQAGQRKLPIATTSWRFNKWQEKVPWGRKMPDGYVPSKGKMKTYFSALELSVVTNITNYHD